MNTFSRLFFVSFFALSAGLTGFAQVIYDFELTIQPIQVVKADGSVVNPSTAGNPNMELRLAETQKVWDQANIKITFLSWNVFATGFSDDTYYNVGNPPYLATFDNLANPANSGSFNPKVVNLWFVNDLREDNNFGADLAGEESGGQIVIDQQGVNIGSLRFDTIAHEFGHALGLLHGGAANNLMNPGRSLPTGLSQVADGSHSMLTAGQISTARGSGFLVPVPEPITTCFWSALALLGFPLARSLKRRFSRI